MKVRTEHPDQDLSQALARTFDLLMLIRQSGCVDGDLAPYRFPEARRRILGLDIQRSHVAAAQFFFLGCNSI